MDNIVFYLALHSLLKMAKFVKIVILDALNVMVHQIKSVHLALIYFISRIIHVHWIAQHTMMML